MSWTDIVERSHNSFTFSCKNLTTNKTVQYGETLSVETASVIKLPILLCLLYKAQIGELSLDQPVSVLPRHVGRDGSGIIQYFNLSQPIALYNLVLLMIAESDNVATNVIIELLGKQVINTYISMNLALKHTKLEMEFFDFTEAVPPAQQSIGVTTALEMMTVIEKLLGQKLLNEAHTTIALEIMRHTATDHFCRRLPQAEFKAWGNKTGSMIFDTHPDFVLNDSGYILSKTGEQYVFAMFMRGMTTQKTVTVEADYKIEFANVAKAIFTELVK